MEQVSAQPERELPPGRELATQNGASSTLDESAFAAWLATAVAGERFVYHVGHLGFDRCVGSHLTQAQRRILNRVASRAFAWAELGRLALTQRRLADGCMAYLATKTGARHAEVA